MQSRYIIEYDGYCNFCDGFINFVIRNERDKGLFLLKHTIQEDAGSIILHCGEWTEFTNKAIAIIFENLRLPYRFIGVLFRIPIISHFGYKIFAKHRYILFGKKDACDIGLSREIASRLVK